MDKKLKVAKRSLKPLYLAVLYFFIAITAFAIFFILRIDKFNPYYSYPNTVTRFNKPQNSTFDIEGLYKEAKFSRFFVNNELYIEPLRLASDQKVIIFLGGSSTEGMFVDEGSRFPELVTDKYKVLNYGVSGNNIMDCFFNLEFLVGKLKIKPKIVFVHEAINDLSLLLESDNVEIMDTNYYGKYVIKNRLKFYNTFFDFLRRQLFPKVNIYITSKLRNHFCLNKNEYNPIIKLYSLRSESSRKNPPLSNEEFEIFMNEKLKKFLAKRSNIIKLFKDYCKNNNIELIFITQPNSYRYDFVPFRGRDLREFPVIKNRSISVEKARIILDRVNGNTVNSAKNMNIKLIDANAYFERINADNLFYDSVHLTSEGCKVLAEIIRKEFKDE